VHDVQGRTIRELATVTGTAGAHEMRWDGRNALGREVGSGVYFFRLSDSGSGADSPAEKALRVR
jgi:flagellar hook assembly protein FlgD